MTNEIYSDDIWDYLDDMPYMPGRKDRDELVLIAESNPEALRRVHIWDYFFRIKSDDVGQLQRLEIEDLEQKRNQTIDRNKRDVQNERDRLAKKKLELERSHQSRVESLNKQISNLTEKRRGRITRTILGAILVVIGIAAVLALADFSNLLDALSYGLLDGDMDYLVEMLCVRGTGTLLGSLGFVIGLLLFIVNSIGLASLIGQSLPAIQSELEKEDKKFQEEVSEIEQASREKIEKIEAGLKPELERIDERTQRLRSHIRMLISQIPAPPSDETVHSWLQEDISLLTNQAAERSGLAQRLIKLKDAPNPLCILGPAELQDVNSIPQQYIKYPDRRKHLKARQFAILPDGIFEDFYGVYNLEFILIAEDMLSTYGCYYDFITGRVTGERTSEQYYDDVVAISTKKEFREVEISNMEVPIEDAPTFSMSLKSGETREVTFASQSYFDGIRKQLGEGELPQFEIQNWERNPEIAADNAIKALRSRLRAHKGLPGEAQ